MNDNLDQALKSYFSKKSDVPQDVKNALRAKLHMTATLKQENLGWLLLLVPCVILSLVAIFFAVEMLFGLSVAVILSMGYFFVATLGGATLLLCIMVIKNKNMEELS